MDLCCKTYCLTNDLTLSKPCHFFYDLRLGNARGERSKNVWKGKQQKLSGNVRKKKRLVKEQHVKLLKRKLSELECGKRKPCHLVMNLRKDLMIHK